MKMPFCLHPDVKRHECDTIVGKDVVFISVQQDGIVDLSELRAKGPNSKVARLWLHHLDMKFGCEDFHLLDLLRWSVTSAFPQLGRKTFPMQVVWNIGRALEKLILVNLSAEGVCEVSGLRLECEVSPSARHRCVLPRPGCQAASAVAAHSNTLASTHMLQETAQQVAFMKQGVKQQQTMKDKPIRKAASLQQTMQDQAPIQVPLSMQEGAGKNATKRRTRRSREAASLPNACSARIATARPAKKRARSKY